MRRLLAAGLMSFSLLASPAFAEQPATASTEPAAQFTPAQKTEIEAIVRNMLLTNPTLVADALDKVQEEMKAREAAATSEKIRANRDRIYDNGGLAIGGNPQGDVTIVEFFDYNCGYCRSAHQELKQLLSEDKNIRIIYREFPILGPNSIIASRMALAANEQGKYLEMHDKLFSSSSQLNADAMLKIAQDMGLNMTKVTAGISDPNMLVSLRGTIDLATDLGIRGTPAFIIGDKLFPGAMSLEQMRAAVAEARAEAKNQPAKPTNP